VGNLIFLNREICSISKLNKISSDRTFSNVYTQIFLQYREICLKAKTE